MKDLLRGIAWDTELEKREAQKCWLIFTPLKTHFESVFYCWGGNQAGVKEVLLSQSRMQDLGDVNHLFLSSHRSRKKAKKGSN